MDKVGKLVRAFVILSVFPWINLLPNVQAKLENISATSESQLQCIFDGTNGRRFCGVIPAQVFIEHRNVTLKYYQNGDHKGQLLGVWRKSCDAADTNSLPAELFDCKKMIANQLFDGTEFIGNRTSEDTCSQKLVQYFTSMEETLRTYCSHGIRDIVAGLPLKCIGQKPLADRSYGECTTMELINRFRLMELTGDSNSKELAGKRNYFIDVGKYLPKINRQTIQRILDSCWREQILDSQYDLGTLVFTLARLKSKIYVHQVNLNSMLRISGYGSVLFVQNKRTRYEQIITDPETLLDVIKKELIFTIPPEPLNRLKLELKSHTLNTVLANWHKYEIDGDLWQDSHHIHDLIPKRLSDYSHKFEKFLSNGHPYYPIDKSKIGFSAQDILSYSPEFQSNVFLMLAAVHKRAISVATNIDDFDYRNWFAQHFPQEWEHWVDALSTKGIGHEDYVPLPIHPWQVTHLVESMFADLIGSETLVLLAAQIEASPTSSMRTMLPTRNLTAPYIKVPLSVPTLGLLRTHPSDLVKTAPILSHLMADILANESSISEKLNIMREDIGLHLNTVDESRAEHLTVSFRENVVTCCLSGDEVAVAVAALFEKVPATDTSLFVHIMEFAGYTTFKGAVRYFTKYVDLVLGSYLDLYLVYGIALEGHQQNTLAVFERGHIKRFIAKDLTGIKIYGSVSKAHPFFRNTSVSSFFEKCDEFSVRTKLLHNVYQSHLGELLSLVAQHFSSSEKLLWDVIADKTRDRFEAVKERVHGDRWRTEYDAILKADWPARSFLTRILRIQFASFFEKSDELRKKTTTTKQQLVEIVDCRERYKLIICGWE